MDKKQTRYRISEFSMLALNDLYDVNGFRQAKENMIEVLGQLGEEPKEQTA